MLRFLAGPRVTVSEIKKSSGRHSYGEELYIFQASALKITVSGQKTDQKIKKIAQDW